MSEIILIVFVVGMMLLLLYGFMAGNAALSGYPWAGHGLLFILLLCLGLAVWGGFSGGMRGRVGEVLPGIFSTIGVG